MPVPDSSLDFAVHAVLQVCTLLSAPLTCHIFPIAWQSFDHAEGDPVEGAISVDAESKVILVEGNYLLMFDTPPWDGLKSLFDERWFVSCEQPILR